MDSSDAGDGNYDGVGTMTEGRTDPAAAAGWLIDERLMGVVLLDPEGRVTDCRGGLVDWVKAGDRSIDSMPFLIGYEDDLESLAARRRPPLFLPRVCYWQQPEGHERSFSIRCFPRQDAAGVALIFQDATAVAQLERSVLQQRNDLALAHRRLTRAKDAAEAANHAKSVFLANVSHELRTPLNVIIGNAEILRDWDPERMPVEDLHIFADDIMDNGTYLLDHINDLLDLAKAEAGGMDLVDESMNLESVVDASVAVVCKLPYAGGLTIRHRPMADLPWLRGDPRRIRQALLNLLGNAVKFTPDGGTVTVRTFLGEDRGLAIEVADTGIGIAAGDLGRVLQPFVQVEAPVENRTRSGTGLGLPLAKSLIELHDGTLTLESNPGEGTRVTLRFAPERTECEA